MSESMGKKNDVFAKIAAGGIRYRGNILEEPAPPELENKYLPLNGVDQDAVFKPNMKMNTREQLLEELKNQRQRYAPFMKNLAPELESFRCRAGLEKFDWRIEKNENRTDLFEILQSKTGWQEITVPHYGGPLGKAVTYYRTVFDLDEEYFKTGSVFICFKGVDYKASVFVNGYFLGTHEGFFAPFEFEFIDYARKCGNTLVIKVENDYVGLGNESETSNGIAYYGDKIYASTGLGYDDPQFGWHHCPPGMGVYQDVFIEARPRIFIGDIFVRPLEDIESAEAWIEINNCDIEAKEISLFLSLYGRNFEEMIFDRLEFKPESNIEVGVGDSFTEAILKAEGTLNGCIPLMMEKGRNRLIVPFKIPGARRWEPDNPWLYQLHVRLEYKGQITDTYQRHFGMRSFQTDTGNNPKGMFCLNGRPIRLRGANTMGHEQQCVFRKDFGQLMDDILLAKICNMNFLRITQRPVQPEVYDYCDMLGLMTQADFPLFGVLSRGQFCEAVRQAEEMERLIRSHPSSIMVTYINEPFPNAGNKPHRYLTRDELESFFKAADLAVKLNNPDRVIKCVDGDYDPPSDSLPDNHCYPCWYNGHGIDIGRLNRGYWLPVKPGWYYACGEYGVEGLDPINVMRKYYPGEWLPWSMEEEKDWTPNQIRYAQTGNFHYFFYETPDTLNAWVRESQKHQAWATRIMTEAFRRNSRMVSFAIHLFIDAFPSGWMKTIMDVDRNPKPAYFAYKDALEPLMVHLRTDRFKYFAGEEVKLEAWICNDKVEGVDNSSLHCQVEIDDKIALAAMQEAVIPSCNSRFQGFVSFKAPEVEARKSLVVRIALKDKEDRLVHDSQVNIEVFPELRLGVKKKAFILGDADGKAARLAKELKLGEMSHNPAEEPDVIIVDDFDRFKKDETRIREYVENGSTLLFLELLQGEYDIFGSCVKAKDSGMLPLHFASRNTGHYLVNDLMPDDIRLWYERDQGCITPLLDTTLKALDFAPVLTSGNTDENGAWGNAMAAVEKKFGKGCIRICQVKLAGRVLENPIAYIFAGRLVSE